MEDVNTGGKIERRTINQIWNSPPIRQLYSSIGALLPAISTGCLTGYSSIILPQLEGRDSIIDLNASKASWIDPLLILTSSVRLPIKRLRIERLPISFQEHRGEIKYWICCKLNMIYTWGYIINDPAFSKTTNEKYMELFEDYYKNSIVVIYSAASIAVIPIMVFPFACGYSQEKYGSKKTHYVMSLIFTVGWITIALSQNIEMLLAGRFLAGVGVGFQSALSSVFIGETTSPKIRHIYLAGVAISMEFGILLVHLLGTFLHWKTAAWICSSLTALSGLMMLHLPDTPNRFITRGQISEGGRVFRWYRGSGLEAQNELRKMVQAAQESKRESGEEGTYRKIEWIYSNFKKRVFLLPLFIMGCYFALLQISGDSLVAFYSIQIVKDVLGEKFNPYAMMLIVDIIRLLTMMFSSLILMRYIKRRTATLFSGILAFVGLSGMAVLMYLQNNGHIPKTYFGFTIAFLVIHAFSLPLGLLLLPWMLLGELFPANLKGLGSGICIFITAFVLFIVTKTAPHLFESIGIPLTFAFYAILVFILTVVIATLLPETKGKTLQEIEENFKGKVVDGRGRYENPNNIIKNGTRDDHYN